MRIVYNLEETEAVESVVNEMVFSSNESNSARLGAFVVDFEELDLAVI
jgi:hypothetical protein